MIRRISKDIQSYIQVWYDEADAQIGNTRYRKFVHIQEGGRSLLEMETKRELWESSPPNLTESVDDPPLHSNVDYTVVY